MLRVVYGSSTGTAEDEAVRVASQLGCFRGRAVEVLPADELSVASLVDRCLLYPHRVFLALAANMRMCVVKKCSSSSCQRLAMVRMIAQSFHGCDNSLSALGVVPNNMSTFWKHLLKRSIPISALAHLKYAVFGFGDSSYEKFNAAARKLSVRLRQLGATELLPIGLGDDQSAFGYLATLDAWLVELTALLHLVSAPGSDRDSAWSAYSVTRCQCRAHVVDAAEQLPEQAMHPAVSGALDAEASDPLDQAFASSFGDVFVHGAAPMLCAVEENSRMTASDWTQTVHLVSLRLPSRVAFAGGDIAIVYPSNGLDVCSRLLARLGLRGDSCVRVQRKAPVSSSTRGRVGDLHCTLHTLVRRYLDISGTPKRNFFSSVATLAANSEEADKLLELSSAQGYDLFFDYCARERRSFLEVLEEFPSIALSVEQLVQLVPVLRPRYFSIASSGQIDSTLVQICVALVSYSTPYRRAKEGVCSAYLTRLRLGEHVWVAIKKGVLAVPAPDVPCIMVGPGTGVAPMRAIAQELTADSRRSADSVLFFGCRGRLKDDLFAGEWRHCAVEGPPLPESTSARFSVVKAYSRDGPDKVYVTHCIQTWSSMLWRLIDKGAVVFVSGSAKNMPRDVRAAIVRVIAAHGGRSEAEALKYLSEMEKRGRYVAEVWS